jgi:hypothetical protein
MPCARQHAVSVLASRQAMVIGPTPPGTGVIAPATRQADAKSTSPTIRVLPSPRSGAGRRLMPTSMTVAPGRQARHGHDLAADRDDEAGAGRQPHLAHRHRSPVGAPRLFGSARRRRFGSVEKGILRLGHADRQVAVALLFPLLQLVAHLLVGHHLVGAVDALGDRLDLLEQRHLVGIERREAPPRFRRSRPPCSPAPRCPRALRPSACTGSPRRPARRTSPSPPDFGLGVGAKWLIATTTGTPKPFTFSMWRPRLAQPF